ncbi:hypothetical protein [Vibrio phage vB_ValS_PJ32]|nr:hypothetical protein [Vibrio phage vB_ValS_PJ32]
MLKVAKKCCGQCLFTSKRIVSEQRKDSLIRDCVKNDTHFTCHKATIKKEDVVCRGFYENHSTNMIRISGRLGMIEFVEVE